MSCPVMAAASSESKKLTKPAISSGRISRPMGGRRGVVPVRAGSISMGVSVAAGDTRLTVTPEVIDSAAQLRANDTSAAFVAAY